MFRIIFGQKIEIFKKIFQQSPKMTKNFNRTKFLNALYNMRIKLGRFYASPAVNPTGPSTLVQYSLPYVDSFGMGLMVTASKAVIDDSGQKSDK